MTAVNRQRNAELMKQRGVENGRKDKNALQGGENVERDMKRV